MYQVFISHRSSKDHIAAEIVEKLESHGIHCWMAPRNLPVGSDYTREIPRAIEKCPFFLLILSEESQESNWVIKELAMAIEKKKYIIPVRIEPLRLSETINFLLANVQIRDYDRDQSRTILEIVSTVYDWTRHRGGPEAEESLQQRQPEWKAGHGAQTFIACWKAAMLGRVGGAGKRGIRMRDCS